MIPSWKLSQGRAAERPRSCSARDRCFEPMALTQAFLLTRRSFMSGLSIDPEHRAAPALYGSGVSASANDQRPACRDCPVRCGQSASVQRRVNSAFWVISRAGLPRQYRLIGVFAAVCRRAMAGKEEQPVSQWRGSAGRPPQLGPVLKPAPASNRHPPQNGGRMPPPIRYASSRYCLLAATLTAIEDIPAGGAGVA